MKSVVIVSFWLLFQSHNALNNVTCMDGRICFETMFFAEQCGFIELSPKRSCVCDIPMSCDVIYDFHEDCNNYTCIKAVTTTIETTTMER